MRVFACITAYLLGVGLAFVAAVTCSVGPEPARTQLGKTLAFVYRPYFDLFCGPFGSAGFIVALTLSGVPLAALVWLVLWLTKLGGDD